MLFVCFVGTVSGIVNTHQREDDDDNGTVVLHTQNNQNMYIQYIIHSIRIANTIYKAGRQVDICGQCNDESVYQIALFSSPGVKQ